MEEEEGSDSETEAEPEPDLGESNSEDELDDEKELNGMLFPCMFTQVLILSQEILLLSENWLTAFPLLASSVFWNAEWPFKHEPRVKEEQKEDAGNDEAEAEKEEPSSGDEADVEISDTEGEQEKPVMPTLQVSTFSALPGLYLSLQPTSRVPYFCGYTL